MYICTYMNIYRERERERERGREKKLIDSTRIECSAELDTFIHIDSLTWMFNKNLNLITSTIELPLVHIQTCFSFKISHLS